MEDPDQARLEQLLTCPVCHDLFKDPLQLPCGHSMCTGCLENLVRHLSDVPFRCPDCRATFGESFDAPKSYSLASISEDYRLYKTRKEVQSRGVFCDLCQTETLALKTCLKCEVSMCKHHLKDHVKLPVFTEHPLVLPLHDLLERKCPQHNDQVLKYYCRSSRRYICVLCSFEKKQISKAADLSNVLWRQFNDNMEQHCKVIHEQVSNTLSAVNEMQTSIQRKNSHSHSNGVPVILLLLWFIVLFYAYNYSSENQSLRESLERHLAQSPHIYSRNVESLEHLSKNCKTPDTKDDARKLDADGFHLR